MKFLVFRLYGPLAAWGEVAVGEQRHSHAHPSRSAVLGLVAAASGVRRDQESELARIGEDYGFSVMVEASGEWLRDYHTAQVPPAKGKVRYHTRRDELRSPDLYTILSQRDYRTDACYSVALWCQHDSPKFSVEDIRRDLLKPRLPLYLGRKSCPLALPLNPMVINTDSLVSAFEKYHLSQPKEDGDMLNGLSFSSAVNYYWESLPKGVTDGISVQQIRRRRDKVLSRKRWQFGEREEYMGVENKGES